MLYLVRPLGQLSWSDLPASLVLSLAGEHSVDLASLEWKPSELVPSADLVRLALRHGTACSAGIVVDGIIVSDFLRPAELAKLTRESRVVAERAKAAMPEEIMEQLVPGWAEHGRKLDAAVAQSMSDEIDHSMKELEALLAAPLDEALLQHWQSLHGVIPEPA